MRFTLRAMPSIDRTGCIAGHGQAIRTDRGRSTFIEQARSACTSARTIEHTASSRGALNLAVIVCTGKATDTAWAAIAGSIGAGPVTTRVILIARHVTRPGATREIAGRSGGTSATAIGAGGGALTARSAARVAGWRKAAEGATA